MFSFIATGSYRRFVKPLKRKVILLFKNVFSFRDFFIECQPHVIFVEKKKKDNTFWLRKSTSQGLTNPLPSCPGRPNFGWASDFLFHLPRKMYKNI